MRTRTQLKTFFAGVLIALATIAVVTTAVQVMDAGQSKSPPVVVMPQGPPVTPDDAFLPPVAYDSGGFTASFVAVGDVNGDDKLDLVVGNECATSGCASSGAGVVSCWATGTEPSRQPWSTARAAVRDLFGQFR